MMEFRLTEEQEMFKRGIREYGEKVIFPRARDIDEKEAGIPVDIIRGLTDIMRTSERFTCGKLLYLPCISFLPIQQAGRIIAERTKVVYKL